MIEVAAEGPRRRKVYRVTDAGLADIRLYEALADRAEWAQEVPPAGPRP